MRSAFTLIEIVVVIMILGIIAAIAVPRYFDTSTQATENGLRQSLAVIRDAIELYGAQHGELPGQSKGSDDFQAELASYLRGDFPENPFGAKEDKASRIKIRDNGTALFDHIGGDEGWLYDNLSGEFISNSSELSSDGVTTYGEF